MLLYLNHFDIQPRIPLDRLKADGWNGLRRNVRTVEEAQAVAKQHRACGLGLLLLLDEPPTIDTVRLAVAVGAIGFPVEVGNEWDSKGWDPQLARGIWYDCATGMRAAGSRLVTGGVSSLSVKSSGWLTEATKDLPADVVIGVHGYPGANQPQDPREAKGRYLGCRGYWVTEVGWHRGPRPRGFPLCFLHHRRTEDEQAACFREDAQLAWEAGVGLYVAYQVVDGRDPDNPEDCNGLYRNDGSARPAVKALTRGFKE